MQDSTMRINRALIDRARIIRGALQKAGQPLPSQSAILRAALERGLEELEKSAGIPSPSPLPSSLASPSSPGFKP